MPKNKRKLLSIIIPTYKRQKALLMCLNRLKSTYQNINGNCYELIISDDDYSRQTRTKVVARYKSSKVMIKYITGPQKGPAANRNNGAKSAVGDWLIFLDDDCLPSKNLIKNYLEIIKTKPDVQAIEGKIKSIGLKPSLDAYSPVNYEGGKFLSCNIAIKKTLFQEIRGFSELFPFAAMEDIELKTRLDKRNIPILFTKEASVSHPWRCLNASKFIKENEASLQIYLKLHPDQKQFYRPSKFLWTFFKNWFNIIKQVLKGKGKGLLNASKINIFYLKLAFSFIFLKITSKN